MQVKKEEILTFYENIEKKVIPINIINEILD